MIDTFLPSLNLLATLSALFATTAVYLLYCVVLKPKMAIKYYTDQGGIGRYVPLIGDYGKRRKDVPITGDFLYDHKKIMSEKSPEEIKMFVTNFGSHPAISLVDPTLIKEFIFNLDSHYVKSNFSAGILKVFIPTGLVTSEGKVWKHHRRIISTAFHFDFIKESTPVIAQVTKGIFDELAAKGLEKVDLMQEFQRITGHITSRIFFGEDFAKQTWNGMELPLAIADMLHRIMLTKNSPVALFLGQWFVKMGVLPAHRRLLRDMATIRGICRKCIQDKKKERASMNAETLKQQNKKTLLDILLSNEGENSLSEEEIIDEFLTFLAAGTDTTGHLMVFAAYYVSEYSEVYRKALKEAETVLPSTDKITYEDAEKMTYTLALMKETLRHASPATVIFIRSCTKDHMLNDIRIKKGTYVTYYTALNTLKQGFLENANGFVPERFLANGEAETKLSKEPYYYLPFASGPRNCIGQHLALLEARVIMAMFLKRFEMEVPKDYVMKYNLGFLYEPLEPFAVKLVERSAKA